jgi:hypothetical protein
MGINPIGHRAFTGGAFLMGSFYREIIIIDKKII